jgi:hypothetical protein
LLLGQSLPQALQPYEFVIFIAKDIENSPPTPSSTAVESRPAGTVWHCLYLADWMLSLTDCFDLEVLVCRGGRPLAGAVFPGFLSRRPLKGKETSQQKSRNWD